MTQWPGACTTHRPRGQAVTSPPGHRGIVGCPPCAPGRGDGLAVAAPAPASTMAGPPLLDAARLPAEEPGQPSSADSSVNRCSPLFSLSPRPLLPFCSPGPFPVSGSTSPSFPGPLSGSRPRARLPAQLGNERGRHQPLGPGPPLTGIPPRGGSVRLSPPLPRLQGAPRSDSGRARLPCLLLGASLHNMTEPPCYLMKLPEPQTYAGCRVRSLLSSQVL